MTIIAKGEKTVGELQEEFSMKYPYLKIEFYVENEAQHPVPQNTRLDFALKTQVSMKMLIKPQHTIQDIIRKFKDKYNICISIMAQSDKTWVQVTKADYWSLEYQNDHAQRLNMKINELGS